jgi:hypothetical protein
MVALTVGLFVLTGCGSPHRYEERGSLKDTYSAPTKANSARPAVKKRKPVKSKTGNAKAGKAKAAATKMARPAPPPTAMASPPPAAARPAVVTPEPLPERAAPPSRPVLPVAPPPVSAPPVEAPAVVAPPQSPPPAVSPPPAEAPPKASSGNGERLLQDGRDLFQKGEVLAAREKFVAALTAPLPDVLLELARTYDPNYLDKLPKTDADADVERARALYEQAVALGSTAAQADLQRLQGR